MIDEKKTKIKNYIYIINLAVVTKRSLNIYLDQKNCELYKKLIKLFS